MLEFISLQCKYFFLNKIRYALGSWCFLCLFTLEEIQSLRKGPDLALVNILSVGFVSLLSRKETDRFQVLSLYDLAVRSMIRAS